MPAISKDDSPEALRPYLFHKLELVWSSSTTVANGTCPFCDREKKFFVSLKLDDGRSSCKVCGYEGNAYTFIRTLYERSLEMSRGRLAEYEPVAIERRIDVETLLRWGFCKSIIDQEWMLPAYGSGDEINNLYRWQPPAPGQKRIMMGTRTFNHCIFGAHLGFHENNLPIWITEGPFDGMALDMFLRSYKLDVHGRAIQVMDEAESLREGCNIISVPGCNTFRDEWINWFKDRDVTLIYDNDHPKLNPVTKKMLTPAGFSGLKTAVNKISRVAGSIRIVNWGAEGYDRNLPSGFDLRDLLTGTQSL